MNLRTLGLTIVLAAAFNVSAKADLNFFFTITGDATGNEVGPFTGEIIGLQDNADSVPTDIIITSPVPSFPSLTIPYDLATSGDGWDLSGGGGSFTVSGGVITGITSPYSVSTPNLGGATIYFNFYGYNGYANSANGSILNADGYPGGVTFTSAAVPEPSQYGMGIFLAVAGFMAWRKFSSKTTPCQVRA